MENPTCVCCCWVGSATPTGPTGCTYKTHQVRENPDEDDEDDDAASMSSESESGDEREAEERKQQQQKAKDKLLTMDPKEITYEMVARKLREIVLSRWGAGAACGGGGMGTCWGTAVSERDLGRHFRGAGGQL